MGASPRPRYFACGRGSAGRSPAPGAAGLSRPRRTGSGREGKEAGPGEEAEGLGPSAFDLPRLAQSMPGAAGELAWPPADLIETPGSSCSHWPAGARAPLLSSPSSGASGFRRSSGRKETDGRLARLTRPSPPAASFARPGEKLF